MTTRDKLVTKAKIGSIEFVATACSGPGQKRIIARERPVGGRGAYLVDLGAEPREEKIDGVIDEEEYKKLKALMDEGKVQTITHPLFGTFQGRIEGLDYNADAKSLVNVSVMLVEDGVVFKKRQKASLPAAASSAKAAGALFKGDLDDIPDWNPQVSDAADSASDAFDAFSGSIDDAVAGDTGFQQLGADFDVLGGACDSLFSALDDLGNTATELIDVDIAGSTYDMLAACRKVVDAAQQTIAESWQPFTVVNPLSLMDVAREFLPTVDEDEALQRLMDSNPAIIDINAITEGVEILIPV